MLLLHSFQKFLLNMVKCGFCHAVGHNRRRCPEIAKLGARGIPVLADAIIEDFPDRDNDPDYVPEEETSISSFGSSRGEVAPPEDPRHANPPPPPSDNPQNRPAQFGSTNLPPSPIFSSSLDEIAEQNGLFNDELFSSPLPGPYTVSFSESDHGFGC